MLNDYVQEQEEPGALPGAVYTWSLRFTTALQGRAIDYPHFTEEETETQGVMGTDEPEYKPGWAPKSRLLVTVSDGRATVREVGKAERGGRVIPAGGRWGRPSTGEGSSQRDGH